MKKHKQSRDGSSSRRNYHSKTAAHHHSRKQTEIDRDHPLQEDSQSFFQRAQDPDQSYRSGSGSEEHSGSSDSSEKANQRYQELLGLISHVSAQIQPLRDKVEGFTPVMTALFEECKGTC